MRKLKIIEHISLDGVIQHSSDDGDFPYGDWTAPYRTPAGRDATNLAASERLASAVLASAALGRARSAPAPCWWSLYHSTPRPSTVNSLAPGHR